MRVKVSLGLTIGVIALLATLTGCAPSTAVHLTERGRNIVACKQMAHLYQKLYDDSDAGKMGDPTAYVNKFLASWTTIGKAAHSEMGNWLIANAKAAKAALASGNTAGTEAKGEAANNGESVQADKGSLQTRCSNLGVKIP